MPERTRTLTIIVVLPALAFCCGRCSTNPVVLPDGPGAPEASSGGDAAPPPVDASADAPPSAMSFHVKGTYSFNGGAPSPAVPDLAFTLALRRSGQTVTGFAGALHTVAAESATVAVKGTLAGNSLTLASFQLPVNVLRDGKDCYVLHKVKVDALSATLGPSSLSGMASVRLLIQDDDVSFDVTPKPVAITGGLDLPPAALHSSTAPAGKALPLSEPALAFTEPICLPAGASAVTVSAAGQALGSVPMPANGDPAGCTTMIKTKLAGHLPFGATVSVVPNAALADLGGHALAGPAALSFSIGDPGDLPNPGFETGDLSGFLSSTAVGYNIQLVGAPDGFAPAQGLYALYLVDLDDGVQAHVTGRIDLAATAKQIVVAIDRLGYIGTFWPSGDSIAAVVADTTQRKTFALGALLDPPSLPLGATGLLHTGYKDVMLDVSGFAGHTVSLTIGKLRAAAACCGPCSHLPGHGPGLLIDNIRVQ